MSTSACQIFDNAFIDDLEDSCMGKDGADYNLHISKDTAIHTQL